MSFLDDDDNKDYENTLESVSRQHGITCWSEAKFCSKRRRGQ